MTAVEVLLSAAVLLLGWIRVDLSRIETKIDGHIGDDVRHGGKHGKAVK